MKMFCIVSREALKTMNGNRGKLAAQAGHAYLHAYWDAEERHTKLVTDSTDHSGEVVLGVPIDYRDSRKATKVCLVVDTTEQLRELEAAYRPVCGVSLVTDAGLTCFDGVPTTTCLGIGPIRDEDVGEDLKCLRVLI